MTTEAEAEQGMRNGSRGQRFRETFEDGTLLALKMEQGITNQGKHVAS